MILAFLAPFPRLHQLILTFSADPILCAVFAAAIALNKKEQL